ncbi:hypothetical protein ACLB2K_032714 [Fragaria x ananassa]
MIQAIAYTKKVHTNLSNDSDCQLATVTRYGEWRLATGLATGDWRLATGDGDWLADVACRNEVSEEVNVSTACPKSRLFRTSHVACRTRILPCRAPCRRVGVSDTPTLQGYGVSVQHRSELINRAKTLVTLASSQAPRPATCSDRCGDVEIPYPFGIEPSCYMEVPEQDEQQFKVTCDQATTPPLLKFLNGDILNQSITNITVGESCWK